MKEMRFWWSFTPITHTNSSRNQFHKRRRFPLRNELLGVEETQRRPTVATVKRKLVGWKKTRSGDCCAGGGNGYYSINMYV
ncbi:hypothetical protein HID58_002496 [Brassica napus]|uniref:Uncharacterized protein n=1 Tax=Brassica napus TaxID=3708 RepID=A0ABQ8EMF1_BRANA|nr:hypothetical protein HID58_002496 [Brassica napus]